MEITLLHSDLQKALELVGRISTKHVTLPVLQCVRIEATGTEISLQATNLDINLEIPLQGEVVESGVVAVPTQIFFQSIQFINQEQVTLRMEDQTLQIETKSTSTSIKLFSPDEFPVVQQLTNLGDTLQGSQFSYGIKSVAFAASQTSIKPELGSVFIQQKKEHSLTFTATDSFRLMEKTVSQKGLTLKESLMIPQKNALELARVCETVGENPLFGMDDNQCALRFPGGVYVSTRLVSGNFPDYEQIIPKEFVTYVTLLKADLQQSFKKTNIFLNKFRQVTLTVNESDLTVSSQNNEVGHTTDTIKATVEGEELSLNFNQQFIMDPLSHIPADSLKLSFAGIGRPMILHGVNDTNQRYLVMPMNK